MKDKWEKGEPVNLSDLLKITPVANEILRLRDEMNMSCADIMWIVSEIVDENEVAREESEGLYRVSDEEDMYDEGWDDDEAGEEDEGRAPYCSIDVKVYSKGKFPEMGFKAGIRTREDLRPFLNMVIDMVNKFGA